MQNLKSNQHNKPLWQRIIHLQVSYSWYILYEHVGIERTCKISKAISIISLMATYHSSSMPDTHIQPAMPRSNILRFAVYCHATRASVAVDQLCSVHEVIHFDEKYM